MKSIQVCHYAPLYDDCFIRVYRSFTIHKHNFPHLLDIAININFTIPYYAGIMLNAFNDLLCSKLCWHNKRVPICSYYTLYTMSSCSSLL